MPKHPTSPRTVPDIRLHGCMDSRPPASADVKNLRQRRRRQPRTPETEARQAEPPAEVSSATAEPSPPKRPKNARKTETRGSQRQEDCGPMSSREQQARIAKPRGTGEEWRPDMRITKMNGTEEGEEGV
ncbi:Hypothetical predicted protein [Pelobates cultripes]|uniref:Uncharacterized protein n=1 Tax=Pelobates cultripes TaxID=61616 RepID=A0AAD1RT54_PELCU|nr:Hypothetical predicted protein [Pelobates cultripes]